MDEPKSQEPIEGFPTQNVLVAHGSFEMQVSRSSDSPVGHIRVGWYEESGTGSSVSWSSTGGTNQDLAQGLHDVEVPSESFMLTGTAGDDARIVAAWDLGD